MKPEAPLQPGWARDAINVALVALAYLGAQHVAFLFPDAQQVLAAIWPSGGIGLAALLIHRRRLWLPILTGIFLAGNLANLLEGRPLFNSLGFMTANVLESLACAWVITHWCGENITFTRVKEVLILFFAATVINGCTALLGAAVAALTSLSSFWGFWQIWWVADGLGILIVAPLLVTWHASLRDSSRFQSKRMLEATLFSFSWVVMCWICFQNWRAVRLLAPHPYMLIPLIAYAALRFSQRGVTTALAILTVISLTSDSVRIGPLPWGGNNLAERVLLAQAFIASAGSMGILLNALFSERQQAQENLQKQEKLYQTLVENTPDIITRFDRQYRHLYVNPAVETEFGVAPASMIGKTPQELGYTPEQAIHLENAIQQIFETRKSIAFELVTTTSSGKKLFLSRGVPEFAKDGTVTSALFLHRNISERKQTEEQLQMLKHSIDDAPDPAYWVDPEGQVLYVNDSACLSLGYTREELLKMRVFDISPTATPERWAQVWKTLKEIGHVSLESIHRRKNGSVFPINLTASYGKFGDQEYCNGFAEDISEHKRAKEALQQSEERYRRITETITDYMYTVRFENGQAGETIHSPGCVAVTGYTEQEYAADPYLWLRMIVPEDYAAVMQQIQKVSEGQGPQALEHRIIYKDGTLRWVKSSLVPHNDEQGQLESYDGLIQDITARKQAEEALQKSEARFRSIFEQSANGYLLTAPDGRLLKVNAAMSNMLGYPLETLQQANFRDITHPDDLELSDNNLRRLLCGEVETSQFEKRYLHKNGATIWTLVNTTLVRDSQNTPLYFVTGVTNVTERKQAEEQIKKALAEKETLLRELHHRTKNNMGVISALFDLQIADMNDTRLQAALMETQTRIRSMALVHQKLYEAQDLSYLNLKDYIHDLADLLLNSYRVSLGSIVLSTEMEDAPVLIDTAIPCGLILNELISNALKYAFPDGRNGEIKIQLKRLEGGDLSLTVTDNGVGLPSGFDIRKDGRLGLQIVRILGESQLNGKIRFETSQGLACHLQFRDDLYKPRV